MDGNGRWARQRSRPRTFGHSAPASSPGRMPIRTAAGPV
ncbi:MAG TPA: undecaprenyl diphosphate synthase family protein, partial [Terricaulis sp.]|nr:undecaprenyl diphosphate synthase family protein [Terricaulis sp.]